MRQVMGVRGPQESVSVPANKIVAVSAVTHMAVIFHGDSKGRGRKTMAYNIEGVWLYDPNSEEFCNRLVTVPDDMLDRLNQSASSAAAATTPGSMEVPKDNVDVA